MESRQQQDTTNFTLLRTYFQGQFLKYFENVRAALSLSAYLLIKGDKSVYFDEKLLKQLSFVIGDKPKTVEQILCL